MEVDACPVAQLRIVDARRAAPPAQVGQLSVRRFDVCVVGYEGVGKALADPHALRQKVAVALGVLLPVLILLLRLALHRRHVHNRRVGLRPVRRVMHFFFAAEAAYKGQKAVVRLALKEYPHAVVDVVIKRAVGDVTVGCKNADAGLLLLAQRRHKNLDIQIIFVNVDLVEDDRAAAHAVAALGVVRPAPDNALVCPPLYKLLCVVVVFFELALGFWCLQNLHNVKHRAHRLLLVVSADVNVVVFCGVVWGDHAKSRESYKAVLTGAAAKHCKNRFPPRHARRGERAEPECRQRLFPRKKLKRKVPRKAHVPAV